MRFNPPPGWPAAPEGWLPPPDWQPEPDWPAAPDGWQLLVDDGQPEQAGAWSPAAVPPAGGTSGKAVAALVLGICGFTLVTALAGIIFGALAIGDVRNKNLRGKGMAITGIVLSVLWLAGIILAIVVAVALGSRSASAPPSSAPNVSGNKSVDVFSLTTGDCFDNPTTAAVKSVSNVTQTPCDVPHNAQIYATFKLKGSMLSYPGTAKTESLAETGCNSRAAASLDRPKLTNSMGIRFLFPVEGSWLAGRRTVSCMIVNTTPTLTSSLLSSSAS
jgi:hypothetical protein